mgnify:CR=1 FL=1
MRYHSFDALRTFAMLSGIVVHASMPYWLELINAENSWPTDSNQSISLQLIYIFIHSWRMPVFFLLAGFFAHLLIQKKTILFFISNRIKRIAIPLLIFSPIIFMTTIILKWYGFIENQSIIDLISKEGIQTINSFINEQILNGDLFGHLWFLYYLLLMYIFLLLSNLLISNIKSALTIKRIINKYCFGSYPYLLIFSTIFFLLWRELSNGEAKPFWPINWADLSYHYLFFLYGFGLYSNKHLITSFAELKKIGIMFFIGIIAFIVYLGGFYDYGIKTLIIKNNLFLLFYGIASVNFSIVLLGLFQKILPSFNRKIRWVSDSSYWIYIIHQPITMFIAFYLFRYNWMAELKFAIICLITLFIGIVSYKYLVRNTIINFLLNGKILSK